MPSPLSIEEEIGGLPGISSAASGVWELHYAATGIVGRAPFATKRRAMRAYRLVSEAMAEFDQYANDKSKTVSFATAIGVSTIAVRTLQAVSIVNIADTTDRQPQIPGGQP